MDPIFLRSLLILFPPLNRSIRIGLALTGISTECVYTLLIPIVKYLLRSFEPPRYFCLVKSKSRDVLVM
jgi:hypothetical protein